MDGSSELRTRIVEAAAALIAAGGRDAATTRAVATAAGVQAPTIYRFFGDKQGLLHAVAEHALGAYVTGKSADAPDPDPVEAIRTGWDAHVAFGLAHPALFAILTDAPASPAARAGRAVLAGRVEAVARAGRLRVSAARAADLLHAAGTGVILTLLDAAGETAPNAGLDAGLSAAAREAVLAAITTHPPAYAPGPRGAASTLRAALDSAPGLSAGERHLMAELLDRIADG